MPLAEVSVLVQPEHLASRGPHPVRGDCVAGPHRRSVLEACLDGIGCRPDRGERAALTHLGPRVPGEGQQCSIQIDPSCHGGEQSHRGSIRQLQLHLAARGRAQPHVVDSGPRRHVRGVQTEFLEVPQRPRGEPVAAALVPRKRGLVDNEHMPARPGECDRRRAAGRPAPDHEHVDQGVRGAHTGQAIARPLTPGRRPAGLPGTPGKRRE
ncbi:unannotated protein [freshwater metagenome]|uniref:Unannotated protein n=1 Tax=freshwater metagenome TaxID=449393 RepID=A0A6J6RHR4_9ZZZZ